MSERILTGEASERLVNAGAEKDDRAAPDSKGREEDGRDTTPRDRGAATDAGRTSGGGSQGHRQPHDRADPAPVRNNP